MKPTILFISVILVYSHASPQSDTNRSTTSTNNSYWSIEYTVGASLSINDNFENTAGLFPGFNAGMELVSRIDDNFGIVINSQYNKFSYDAGNFNYIELTTGPRFYIGHGHKEFFIEVGLGNYISVDSRSYGFDPYQEFYFSTDEAGMGVNGGIGKVFRLGSDLGLVGKLKIHTLFPALDEAIYTGISLGIVFENERKKKSSRKDTTTIVQWSLSLLGGVSDPVFYSRKFTWSSNFGFEAALQTGKKYEFYAEVNYSSFKLHPYRFGNKQGYYDLTFGPRYFIGGEAARGFIDLGGGVYGYFEAPLGYTSSKEDLYGGICAGTGVMVNVLHNVSLILRSKINFIFSERHSLPDFLALSAGIRTEL